MKQLIRHILREHTREIGEERINWNTESFIKRAKEVHGDRYEYSKTKYEKASKPVIITCKIHGDFSQQPRHHLNGKNCPKDRGYGKVGVEEFIKKSNDFYNSKFDYSLVDKIGSDPIKIICPFHGEFIQTPINHLKGKDCPKCNHNVPTTDDFIEKANVVHGNRYDYSQVKYNSNKTPVTIICPKHGEFLQEPTNHLQGKGCPICQESHGEKIVTNILKRKNIKFNPQHRFEDCRNTIKGRYCKKLPFDFYLPNLNVCIEYDGRQHFIPVAKFGGEDGLERLQARDKIKNEYCKKNGIKLIRIPYTMKKEEIEPYILKELGIK